MAPFVNFGFPISPSSGPTSPLLIESFDTLSFYTGAPAPSPVAPNHYASIGDNWWETFSGTLITNSKIVLSTSHVTQGTYSWECSINNVTDDGFADFRTSTYTLDGNNIVTLDLTGYTSLMLDVYVADIGGDMWVYLNCGDFGFSYEDGLIVTTTTTGAQTLTIDLTSATWDLSTTSIRFGIEYNDTGSTFHNVDAYFDNLRATT